ncbi:MAG TPA: hypothetical protein HA362_06250 [Nanoarchaeota archaeon]|nr:hypothetical protein [Nanoarchaeota archaeon]
MNLSTKALITGLFIAIAINLFIIYTAVFYETNAGAFEKLTGKGMAGNVQLCIDWFINLTANTSLTARYGIPFSYDVNVTGESSYYPYLNFTDNTTLFGINITTGVINFTANSSQMGSYSILLTVGNNACNEPDDTMVLSLLVDQPNHAPAINMTNQTLIEGTNYVINVTNYTSDPENDLLKFYDNYARFVIGEDSGIIDFTPDDADVGNHTVRITVMDPGSLSDYQDVMFSIQSVNDVPNLSAVGAKTAEINVTLNITLEGYDPDAGEALAFRSNESWFLNSSGRINTTGGYSNYTFSVLITNTSWVNETFSINITVNDTANTEDSEVISFTVVQYNNVPNITSYAPLGKSIALYTDECQNFSITKEDADGTTPSTSWYYNQSYANETADDYKFCPPNAGSFNVTVVITDGIANDSESWIVSASARPPPPPDTGTTPGGAGGGGAGKFCEPRWACTDWDWCQPGNIQTRLCEDRNNCRVIAGKPAESQSCIYTEFPTCFDRIKNQDELLPDCGGDYCKPCPTCDDGIPNQEEEGIDCGGPCPVCKEVLAPVEVKKLPVEIKQVVTNLSVYWPFWLLLSILLLSMARVVKEVNLERISRVRAKLKTGRDVYAVNRLLAKSYKLIKAKDYDSAKAVYSQAKELYAKLPEAQKAQVQIKELK